MESVPSTSSDIGFQSRISQIEKAKAKHEAEKNIQGTKRSYEGSSATDQDEALSCNEFTPVDVTAPQNRMPLPTLAMTCQRFYVSDKISAAIASAALVDYGLITSNQRQKCN